MNGMQANLAPFAAVDALINQGVSQTLANATAIEEAALAGQDHARGVREALEGVDRLMARLCGAAAEDATVACN